MQFFISPTNILRSALNKYKVREYMGQWDYHQIILLIINVIGGIAVIGSYVHGIVTHPGTGNALWGGVPASMRSLYATGMLLAAAGYLFTIYYILFRIDPAGLQIAGIFNYTTFTVLYFLILTASTLWMPLTYSFIANNNPVTWFGIRTVLIVVALGALLLLIALLTMKPKIVSTAYWLAVAGTSAFFLHTGVLDAILWPLLFKK